MKNYFITLFTLLFVSCLVMTVKAGSVSLPDDKKFCSENEKYCLIVRQAKKESETPDAADEPDENSSENEANVEESDAAAKNYGQAIFYANKREMWTVQLEYDGLPESASISNDGAYVVTFEDLYTTIADEPVIVIYSGSSGSVVKKLVLADFLTKSDVINLRESGNLYDWQRKPAEIDYDRNQMLLSVTKPPRGSENFFNVRIDLANGAVLDEVVDRIPTTKYIFFTKLVEETFNPIRNPERKSECASEDEIEELSTFDFALKIVQKELPNYPKAAQAVRAFGEVVFEVVISPEGEVACADPISGHPLLSSVLKNTLKNWKFEKRETKYKGNIIFDSKIVTTLNGRIID